MTRARIAIAMCDQYPALVPQQAELLPALAKEGVATVLVPWTDAAFEWGSVDGVLVSQTWDYTAHKERFLQWARGVERATRLWNAAEVLAWNAHKSYLRDLAARGAPTIPTVWLPAGARADLAGLLAKEGWTEAIVKPVVAGASRGITRVTPETLTEAQAHLDTHLAREDMMVQPFLTPVRTKGELSVVFFNGEPSHALRKVPASGDYRAHMFFGAANVPTRPTAAEVEAARAILKAAPGDPLYARVDLVEDEQGQPRVMELEVIEPILYLDADPGAPARFARAIAARLGL